MGAFDFPESPSPYTPAAPAGWVTARSAPAIPLGTPAPMPNPLSATNAQVSAKSCDCSAADYEPGDPCYNQCGGNKPNPTPGGGGSCPDGTSGGYADCCPPGPKGQRVWRPDTKTCEYEDDRQKRGEDTCRDNGGLPIKCPPGQESWCNFTTGLQECASVGGGGGGNASGGGGGGGGGSYSSAGLSIGSDMDALLGRQYKKLLKSPSRFTPEVLQSLYGQIASQSSGEIDRGERSVRADAARRGMSRAGSTAAGIRDVNATAESHRGQSMVGVQIAKINTDYQDKMGALDRAQKYLDSMRDNGYRYGLLDEQRRQFDANLSLAYANLSQQRTMLSMQLQSSWDMLRSQQGFCLISGTC